MPGDARRVRPVSVALRIEDSYPILRFSEVPIVGVTTQLIDRPHMRSLGAGDATQGPTAAAVANAVAAATGIRVRSLPMTSVQLRVSAGG